MPNKTITIERYEELLHKEAVYDIQRDMVANNVLRTNTDSCMYGILTREEERKLEAEKKTFKEWLENNVKMSVIATEENKEDEEENW